MWLVIRVLWEDGTRTTNGTAQPALLEKDPPNEGADARPG